MKELFRLDDGLTSLGRSEYVSDWFSVLNHFELRCYVSSDISVRFSIEYNLEAEENKGDFTLATDGFVSAPRSTKVIDADVKGPFARVRIVKPEELENKSLRVRVWSIASVDLDDLKPKSPPSPTVPRTFPARPYVPGKYVAVGARSPRRGSGSSESEPKKKSFLGLGGRKKQDDHDPIATDYRLPLFIPRGTILVGSNGGRVEILPPGIPGEYLMMDESGMPAWKLPYPPKLN